MVFGLTVGLAGFLAAAYPDMHLFTRDVAPVYWVFFGLFFSLAMQARRVQAAVVDSGALPQPATAPRFANPRVGALSREARSSGGM